MPEQAAMFSDEPADEFTWWRTALEHPEWIGTERLPIHEGDPQLGFYRVRGRDGQWQPVAFFRDTETGLRRAERNGAPVGENKMNDLWIWACRQPVTWDAYERAAGGGGWADEPERAPGIGDNLREADKADALRIEYLGEKENAEEMLKSPIKTQDEADRAAIWSKRLRSISNRADAEHAVEKAPALAEGRRIDDRWRELKEQPALLSVRLKRHSDDWFAEQDRLERQRQAAALAEAKRLREIAEQEAMRAEETARLAERKAQETSDPAERRAAEVSAQRALADAGKKIADAKTAEAASVYRPPTAGRTGARTSFRNVTTGRIVDAAKFFELVKDRREIQDALQGVANVLAKAGVAYPDVMEIEKSKKVV